MQRQPDLFANTCFDHHCCGDAESCQMVCPNNNHWQRDMRDLGGLRFSNLPALTQQAVELPLYVPLIDHRNGHRKTLTAPVAALKTSQVFRLQGQRYEAVASDPVGLRDYFRLAPNTRILLRGTGKPDALELYWQHRQGDRLPEQMARLGVDLVIGPNYCHPLNWVRTETLANRMRQLVCLGEMHAAGLSPVPHLNAVQAADWGFWRCYLRDRPGIHFVAVEFQTGNKHRSEGRKVIEQIAAIRDAIGRNLHLLAIGARQYVTEIAARLDSFTLIDSVPYMRTVGGHLAFIAQEGRVRWTQRWIERGEGIDDLLCDNLRAYTAWVAEQAWRGRCNRRISLN
jgi:hypothetical protein